MKDREIDEILKRAAQSSSDVDPALLDRIAAGLRPSLRPVRTLPPTWLLVSGLVLSCGLIALAGAARAGFYGIQNMSGVQRSLVFAALSILVLFAAGTSVSEMIPGSRRRLAPGTLLSVGCLTLLAVFAILFHDYHTEHFLSAGIVCLVTGLLHAIPTAILIYLILRRGFAVNPVDAALSGGALAGLAGITMLEFHCPNFEALHILVWHTAVVLVSGGAGAFLAWALQWRTNPESRKGSSPM